MAILSASKNFIAAHRLSLHARDFRAANCPAETYMGDRTEDAAVPNTSHFWGRPLEAKYPLRLELAL